MRGGEEGRIGGEVRASPLPQTATRVLGKGGGVWEKGRDGDHGEQKTR